MTDADARASGAAQRVPASPHRAAAAREQIAVRCEARRGGDDLRGALSLCPPQHAGDRARAPTTTTTTTTLSSP